MSKFMRKLSIIILNILFCISFAPLAIAEDYTVLKVKYQVTFEKLDSTSINNIETKIGYTFSKKDLLVTALTAADSTGSSDNYERFEFFGDGILEFYLTEILMRNYSNADPNMLTKARTELARQEPLAALALHIGLFKYINTNNSGEVTISQLGDVVEALIAAIYYDGGSRHVQNFISRFFIPMMSVECPMVAMDIINKASKKLKQSYIYSKKANGEFEILPSLPINSANGRPAITKINGHKDKNCPVRNSVYRAERDYIKSLSQSYSQFLVTLPIDASYKPWDQPIAEIAWDRDSVVEPLFALNELMQKLGKEKIVSCDVESTEENQYSFLCSIDVQGFGKFEGKGSSKKKAIRIAAARAYRKIQVASLFMKDLTKHVEEHIKLDEDKENNPIFSLNSFCQVHKLDSPIYEGYVKESNGQPTFYTRLHAPWLVASVESDLFPNIKKANESAATKAIRYLNHFTSRNLTPRKLHEFIKFKQLNTPGNEKNYLFGLSTYLKLSIQYVSEICEGPLNHGILYRSRVVLSGKDSCELEFEGGACLGSKLDAEAMAARLGLLKLANMILKKEIPGF